VKAPDKEGSAATCGCLNTGSETVFIEDRGAVRAGFDHATGLIGGGVSHVTVEDYPISVVGAPIEPHLRHRHREGPKTARPAVTVTVGDGSGRHRVRGEGRA
jgi:hypothetical protein